MASKARVLHCCVCKRQFKYKGADPYLLPCLHAACAGCIGGRSKAITCLLCRESFDKGKSIFLNDAITQAETIASTLQRQPLEIKCTNRDHNLDAVSWCKDCESFFCVSCQAAHSQVRSSSTHRMVSLKEMVAADLHSLKSFCPDHEGYALDLYDETCEILICSKCARSNHKHCQSEELDDVAVAVKGETEDDEKKLAAKLQGIKSMIDESKEKQEMMRKRHNKLKDLLTSRFNSLRDLITKREAEVMKELEFRHLSEMDEAKRVSNKLRGMFRICENTHSYTRKLLEFGNQSDVLMLRKPVKFRTEMALSEEAESFDVVPVHLVFPKESMQAFENSLQTVCNIETTDGDDDSYQNVYANVEGSSVKDVPDIANDVEKGDNRHVDDDCFQNVYENVEVSSEKDVPDIADDVEKGVEDESQAIDMDPDNENENKGTHSEENEEGIEAELIADTDPLSYPSLKFDVERINNGKVHVNNKGSLVNTKVFPEGKLRQYVGTTADTSLPKNKFSYWEVHSDFNIPSKLPHRGFLMEIGVATGTSLDSNYCMSGQAGSRCLAISHCSVHDGVCAKIWSNGQKMECIDNVLSIGSGTQRHGLLYDGTRDILTIFDLKNMAQLVTLGESDLDDDQWPVFGANNSSLAAVQMKLVSGREIETSKSKTNMLKDALVCSVP